MSKHHILKFGQLKRDAATLLIGQIVYRASGIIVLGTVARMLPSSDLGAFFFAEAVAGMLLVVSSFGLNPLFMRRASLEPGRAGDSLAALLAYRVLAAPVYLACACGVAYVAGGVSPWIGLTIAAAAMLEDLSFAFGALFVARRRIAWNVAIGVGVQIVFIALLVVGLRWRPTLGTWAAATLLRALLLAALCGVVTAVAFVRVRVRWDRTFVAAGLPFILIAWLMIARERVDTLLLGLLATPAAVTAYQLAYRVIVAALFVPVTVSTALYPDLSASGADAHNRRRFGRALLGLVGIGTLGTVLVLLVATPLSQALYGPQAAAVAPLLRAGALLLPMLFVEGLFISSLQAIHRERAVVRFMLTGLAVGLLTNVLLVPFVGSFGAVYAQLLASATRLLLSAVELGRVGMFRSGTPIGSTIPMEGVQHARA